ncbi:MAG: DUF5610 domain-containing protein [Chitinivibrionia bacterium]|nr:DUF5610 domain-containing protein [Chitinivibrionia bacterium]
MIQGFGISNASVDSYKTAYAYQRKDGNGVSGGNAKTSSKKDEAVFSSSGTRENEEVREKTEWSGKTNEEIVKGVKEEYKKLQANIIKSMLTSAGLQGGGKNKDLDAIFNFEIPESVQKYTPEELVDMLPDEWKPDAVAERIVNFATSFYERSGLSGEDFYEKIKEAIESGFGAADKQIGGKLPGNIKDVIQFTKNAVAEKLEKWAESMGIKIPYTGEEKLDVKA